MKKLFAMLLAGATLALTLAACGGDAGSSQPADSGTPAPPASESQPAAVSSSEAGPASSNVAPVDSPYDVNALLATLGEAANLGTTIKVAEMDLKLGGVDPENFVEFAGAESQLSSENGGIVIIIHAKEGAASTVATQLEAYKASRMGNSDYAEFENARTNTEGARIQTFGNYVVYAVSATGHEGGWDALDAAIASAFA